LVRFSRQLGGQFFSAGVARAAVLTKDLSRRYLSRFSEHKQQGTNHGSLPARDSVVNMKVPDMVEGPETLGRKS